MYVHVYTRIRGRAVYKYNMRMHGRTCTCKCTFMYSYTRMYRYQLVLVEVCADVQVHTRMDPDSNTCIHGCTRAYIYGLVQMIRYTPNRNIAIALEVLLHSHTQTSYSASAHLARAIPMLKASPSAWRIKSKADVQRKFYNSKPRECTRLHIYESATRREHCPLK